MFYLAALCMQFELQQEGAVEKVMYVPTDATQKLLAKVC